MLGKRRLQGEPTDIRDIKPLENIDRDWRPIVLGLLAAVLVIALGIFLYLMRRKSELTESILQSEHLSPQETALRELEILKSKGFLERASTFLTSMPLTIRIFGDERHLGFGLLTEDNLVEREIESDLLPLCADQGIGVITYSPLAAGFLTGKYRPGQKVPKGTRFA